MAIYLTQTPDGVTGRSTMSDKPKHNLHVIICGCPKSGKSWLKALIAKVLAENGVPISVHDRDLKREKFVERCRQLKTSSLPTLAPQIGQVLILDEQSPRNEELQAPAGAWAGVSSQNYRVVHQ